MCVMHNVRCCCDLFVEVYAHFRSTRFKSKLKTGNYLKNVGVRLKTEYFPKIKLSKKVLLRLSKVGVAA